MIERAEYIAAVLLEDIVEAMSRREFLRRLGAGAAGAAVAPQLLGGTAPTGAKIWQVVKPEDLARVGKEMGFCGLPHYAKVGKLYHVTDPAGNTSLSFLDNETGKITQHYEAGDLLARQSHTQHMADYLGKTPQELYGPYLPRHTLVSDKYADEYKRQSAHRQQEMVRRDDQEAREVEQREKEYHERTEQRERQRQQQARQDRRRQRRQQPARQRGRWSYTAGRQQRPGPEAHEWGEEEVAEGKTAASLAAVLLEAEEEIDPKQWVMSQDTDELRWHGHDFPKRMPPSGIRRTGEGYDKQWDFYYKNWMFTVSTYENGETLWSAHYKTPVYSWSTPEEVQQGFGWSSGGEIERVPPRYNLSYYLAKLKRMADENPDVWKARRIPRMPEP